MALLQISFKITAAAVLIFFGFYLIQSREPIESRQDRECLVFTDIKKELKEIEGQYGIEIKYDIADIAIPELWRKPPAGGTAKAITLANLCRYLPILSRELKKYPVDIIRLNLSNIFLLSHLSFYGVPYGGTSLGRDLFLTGGDRNKGYDDIYLASLFHHEISSIFFRAYHFPENAWSAINPPGTFYAKSDQQLLKTIANDNYLAVNEKLYQQGFLAQYGHSTLENDFNLYAEMAFTQPEKLSDLAEKYPRVRQKADLMKNFYLGISKSFSLILDSH